MNFSNEDVFLNIIKYPNESINIILSDPPYNLSAEWIINEDGRYELKKSSKDFMNKWVSLDGDDLDKLFRESYRILKDGGYLLFFGMDNQLPPFQYYAVKNGLEICQSLYWLSLNRMPKGRDVIKEINKEIYKDYKYGRRPLKQVLETIMVFRKPFKSFKDLEINGHLPIINTERHKREFNMYPAQMLSTKEGLDSLETIYPKIRNSIIEIPYEKEEQKIFFYSNRANNQERNNGLEQKISGSNTYNPKCLKCGKWKIAQGIDKEKYTCSCLEPDFEKPDKHSHPTLKPINLIKEIALEFKLPENHEQKWYIPFAGAGSEIIGLLLAGIKDNDIMACEINQDFYDMALKRIEYYKKTI